MAREGQGTPWSHHDLMIYIYIYIYIYISVCVCVSSAWSASVIVRAGYLLLLNFAKVKSFSLNKSIDVWSTLSRQMINRYGARVSPCSISKKSVSPSGNRTFTFVFLYCVIIAATVSLWISKARSICSIFTLCMESKALERSTNNSIALRFFTWTPSKISVVID